MPNGCRAIVFDFDGVIVESVAIKGRAFRSLFPEFPEHADRFERFHDDNAGMSRHLKIAWFYRELVGREASPGEIELQANRFGALVAHEMLRCPLVAGAAEVLERYSGRLPMFVASGTPEPELRGIVEGRGLAGHFAGVFGAPTEKARILASIATELGVPPSRLLFVGDGIQDAEAARQSGVPFIGRIRPGDRDRLGDVPIARVADLFELEQHLNRLTGMAPA